MSLIRRTVLEGVQRVLVAALLVIVLAVATLSIRMAWKIRNPPVPSTHLAVSELPDSTPPPTAVPLMTPLPRRTATAAARQTASAQPLRPLKVGIVAGHWQNDPGAVCDDGLQEVQINLDIAQRVVALLSLAGYDAEMLAEFSPKLSGYQAAALISIHTDSCMPLDVSGFKVARVSSSLVPELEDRLVSCLIDKYRQETQLNFHRDTITFDMTEYHAFYEIAPKTPGAIIEIGFMYTDRELLTKKQDRVAAGIVNGIKCFIEGGGR